MFKKNSKGFTLVELLVVIAIIGILATLATISLNAARSKARDAKRISDLKQMGSAMELHYTDANEYTGGCGDTESVSTNTATTCSNNAYITWANFKDPSNSTVACVAGATAPCAYAIGITAPPSTGISATDYKFCAYFEKANANIGITDDGGIACITKDGWTTTF